MKKENSSFDNFINEQKEPLGCLMLFHNEPFWNDITSQIDKEDIYDKEGFGLETEPHCTVLYGFKDPDLNIQNKLSKFLVNFPKKEVSVISNKINLFENEEFDVLKYEVDKNLCKKLTKLNQILDENFEIKNDYPDYNPHVTIAYLKPGRGKKYTKNLKDTKHFKNLYYVYSIDGKKHKLNF